MRPEINVPSFRKAISGAIIVGIAGFAWPYGAAVDPYWEITPDGASYMDGAEPFAAGQPYSVPLRPPVTSLL